MSSLARGFLAGRSRFAPDPKARFWATHSSSEHHRQSKSQEQAMPVHLAVSGKDRLGISERGILVPEVDLERPASFSSQGSPKPVAHLRGDRGLEASKSALRYLHVLPPDARGEEMLRLGGL